MSVGKRLVAWLSGYPRAVRHSVYGGWAAFDGTGRMVARCVTRAEARQVIAEVKS